MNTKKKIYDNYVVYNLDNKPIFRCNRKKANWYISKGLAKPLSRYKIKLLFVTKGLGNYNNSYGLNPIENKCVSCGTNDNLTRHHIVPYCYRKFFPLCLKEHNSYDILPLCTECHTNYEKKADILKAELSELYNAPINGLICNNIEWKYVKYSNMLLSNNKNIPKSKIMYAKTQIKNYLGLSRLTKTRLKKISNLKSNKSIKTHGQIVVESIENLDDFIKTWRTHFIENINNKFIPIEWKV